MESNSAETASAAFLSAIRASDRREHTSSASRVLSSPPARRCDRSGCTTPTLYSVTFSGAYARLYFFQTPMPETAAAATMASAA